MKRLLLLSFVLGIALGFTASAQGPLTNAMNLRVRTDASGYLISTLAAYTSPDGPLTNFGNIRLRTDANGYLLTTTVGSQTMSTLSLDTLCFNQAAPTDICLSRLAEGQLKALDAGGNGFALDMNTDGVAAFLSKAGADTAAVRAMQFLVNSSSGMLVGSANNILFKQGASNVLALVDQGSGTTYAGFGSGARVGFTDGGASSGTLDTYLTRLSAGITGLTGWGITSVAVSATAPTVVAGTSASITKNNGTAAFTLFTGTTAVSTAAITFPSTTNGWSVSCVDGSLLHATNITRQVSTSATITTIQNFNTSGVTSAWAANTYLTCTAAGM